MKKMRTFVGIIAVLASLSLAAHAASLKGVDLPDQATVDGKTLVLNGMGVRQATIFKINAYVAGLYLEAKNTNGAEILQSPGVKKIEMIFLRDVGAKDVRGAWEDGLKASCKAKCDEMQPKVTKLISQMPEVKKGDSMTYIFHGEKLEVMSKGVRIAEIEGKEFATLVLSNWIGDHPPNASLKQGMLGTP